MRFATVLAVAFMFAARPAGAVSYFAELHGVLAGQVDTSFNDPVLRVGDPITLTALLDTSGGIDPATGRYFAAVQADGDFLNVEVKGLRWTHLDNFIDYVGAYYEGNRLTGLYLDLSPDGFSPDQPFTERPAFDGNIYDAAERYGLFTSYRTPGFTIAWDFAGSTFREIDAAVPEPASWAMMIAGFGMMGGLSRRRRQSQVGLP